MLVNHIINQNITQNNIAILIIGMTQVYCCMYESAYAPDQGFLDLDLGLTFAMATSISQTTNMTSLYYFFVGANITKYHRLSRKTTEMTLSQLWSLEVSGSRCLQVWFLLKLLFLVCRWTLPWSSSGYYNKNALDWVASTAKIHFSQPWRLRSPRSSIRSSIWQGATPGSQTAVFCLCPHVQTVGKGAPWSFFYNGTHPLHLHSMT